MLQVQPHYALAGLNTFGMQVYAARYATFDREEELAGLQQEPAAAAGILVLGGGSNMLFTGDVPQLVVHNRIKGIVKLREDGQHVWLQVGAGEIWHELVLYAVAAGYAGIENLSLIPGTVGAAPIQNIGAYGVEAKDVIEAVRYYDIASGAFTVLGNEDCRFAYRDSIFKRELKNKVIITAVTFRLNKIPVFNTSYGNIQQELDAMGVTELSIRAISDAVIRIRSSKLPDPREIGNAGSFFKNPEVDTDLYLALKAQYPTIPGYALPGHITKIPAGWLIEQCGWKGYRKDNYGVHKLQALVLVNYGGASGQDIADLSLTIMNSVAERFGIQLEREVQII
ncbi:UDP-N-acetylmuramate dehydrogenase [Taibaiella chishuiensis]|uniref:UDP-N-acetylenolpyruvoylglucosamine reductase n=1 Tax=Taibaiella chishuiensis TaxID=1434707 RepID=A0A2P8DBG1_9BACT|nr:UDP-N-acetylmuramate dehydrogenase [Taibaiella chishuiensis]PSK94561.1 UDP-N-acetylmuramate dehydrogenase [Taibaiella chishuiensis]